MTVRETTDMTLFVRTSKEDTVYWNRQRIVDALIRETNVDIGTAEDISKEVEKQVFSSGIDLALTTSLVRELVDARLIERGLEKATRMHARLGFPLYDVGQLILYRNKENANVPHGPEGTNLILAERIKKEYALLSVFSEDVGLAHTEGDIHIHNLGYIDRPYCSYQSLEYIKKFGLTLPNSLAVAAPAKHAEVLLSHMIRFAAALQGSFAGAIGWDAVNLFFAPYLEKSTDLEIKQLAQMLIYEFAQQAVGRGGQTIFTDVHLCWEVPRHFEGVPAIGPGGEYTGKTYDEYANEARKFVWAIFEVFKKGDASGRPFVFPRPIVHITEKFFKTPDHEEFLCHICDVAGEKGNTCFVFDRKNIVGMSECGSVVFESGRKRSEVSASPWKMRYSATQNVSINLPRIGYKAEKNDETLFLLIAETMKLCARAHIQKKNFIEKLVSYGDEGPLSVLAMSTDEEPFLKIKQAVHIMGMVGLNELVKIHKGTELHESDAARKFGLKIMSYMKDTADKLSAKYGTRFILGQTPAESTAYRFAKLDLKHFSPMAGRFVKGDISKGEIYYTNSTLFSVLSSTDPFDRAKFEGMFHPFIEGETATFLRLGDLHTPKEALAEFIVKVFKKTKSRQVVFSPEFTTCMDCKRTFRGIKESCIYCDSKNVEGIARITGYFSRVSGWNKGKLAELRDRKKQPDFTE